MNKSELVEFQKGNRGFISTHGMIKTRAYSTWNSMRSRCGNLKAPNYKFYGGKGIAVCERWAFSFENFLEDMGHPPDGHTLDRIDSTGDYTPENCRWATPEQQNNNRSFNRLVTLNGVTATVSQLARSKGLNIATVFTRLNRGRNIERAFNGDK